MGEVIAHLAMSLDGFIADPDDGCDELFGFYDSGDVAVKLGGGIPELHVSRKTADLLTAEVGNEGATVVGRRRHDHPRLPGRRAAGRDPGQPGAGDPRPRIPWLAGTRGPVRLSDPAVIEDHGVTHLRYHVRKES